MHDAATTCGFSHDRYTVRITPKQMDILLDPLQSKTLVVKPGIGSSIRLESGSSEPAEGTKSIVNGDEDNAVRAGRLASFEEARRIVLTETGLLSRCVAAAVYPDQDRSFFRRFTLENLFRGDNVKEKAIF